MLEIITKKVNTVGALGSGVINYFKIFLLYLLYFLSFYNSHSLPVKLKTN